MTVLQKSQKTAFNALFLTEMLERYGFYVIQTLLIFYLTGIFHLTDSLSYGILGSITALAYGNSVLGGYIADRLIGHRLAVGFGAILLTLGYGLVACSSDLPLTLWAFAAITLGTGLLKPNTSSMVGFLYPQDATLQRQNGYTLYFVGINIGTMAGSTLGGYIQKYVSWHATFLSACLALGIAALIFFSCRQYLKQYDQPRWQQSRCHWFIAGLILVLMLWISQYVINHQQAALWFFVIAAILSIARVIGAACLEKGVIRRRFIAFLILLVFVVFFYTMYFQMFFSMNLFVARVVDLHFAGLTLVPAVFPPIEALTIVIVGPLMGLFWLRCGRKSTGLLPSIPMKFTLGLFFLALALGIYTLNALVLRDNGLVAPGALMLTYVSMGIGELLVMPVALSMISELLPQRTCGIMMGIFFIALGLAGKCAGELAAMTTVPVEQLHNISAMERIYQHGFAWYFFFCVVMALLALCLTPSLKRLMAI